MVMGGEGERELEERETMEVVVPHIFLFIDVNVGN